MAKEPDNLDDGWNLSQEVEAADEEGEAFADDQPTMTYSEDDVPSEVSQFLAENKPTDEHPAVSLPETPPPSPQPPELVLELADVEELPDARELADGQLAPPMKLPTPAEPGPFDAPERESWVPAEEQPPQPWEVDAATPGSAEPIHVPISRAHLLMIIAGAAMGLAGIVMVAVALLR